ncbi:hypothetical protein LSH36_8g09008 [Paralvinella palmiformis]|uniref:Uncharacterized protein n=1 Tax=Paralvinella palmiformis TaxID=53620 RepID=A0AAD9KE81_9ANNE|nr:hypothetical protein LSH36_8g09008 [Paralvinella palmiformis]
MSAIAIFYFFAGQQVGYCYFRRLIIEGWYYISSCTDG